MATKKAKLIHNKSAFVRGLPLSLSANEVVARAKAAGLKLSARHVYVIRSIAKRDAKKLARRARAGELPFTQLPKVVPPTSPTAALDTDVAKLREAALNLGRVRVLAEIESLFSR